MTWTERKVANLCARAGCKEPPGETHCLCDRHAKEHRERQNRSAVERRAYRRRQAVLPLSTCGGPEC